MIIIYCLISAISIFTFGLIMHLAKTKIDFFKKNKLVIFIFIVTQIAILLLLNKISIVRRIIQSSDVVFIDEYIMYMIATSLSVILNSGVVSILQKQKEKQYIRQEEGKYTITKFQYYRDLVGDISPAMLLYIYKLKINYEDQVVATLLYLQEKGLLKINNGSVEWKDTKLEKLVHYDRTLSHKETGLRKHEVLVLDYATNKISFREFKKKFTESLNEDLENEGYKKINGKEEIDLTEFMMLIILWVIITLIIMLPFLMEITEFSILLVGAYFLAFVSIPIYEGIRKKINIIIRTEKALNLCAKLQGLKNFLTDFSIINEQKVEHVALYEDYILYAIIFNYKGKLDDECKKIYKNLIKNFENKDGFYSFSNVSSFQIFSFIFSLIITLIMSACLVVAFPDAPYLMIPLPLLVIIIGIIALKYKN